MNFPSSADRLTETMGRTRWQWAAHLKAAAEAPTPSTSTSPAFTIALSREAGANGSLVGRALGERLGWPVYDRELLQRVADEMGLRTSLLDAVDEKRKHWLLECLESFTSNPGVSEGAYVCHLLEALLALATHGECVIVGRGAAQVLPVATTLRVRLVAPEKDRVEVIRQRRGLTEKEAVQYVHKVDEERVRFVKNHFQREPNDNRYYDLVLNSSRFTPAECADLIIEALHRMQARVSVRKTGTQSAP